MSDLIDRQALKDYVNSLSTHPLNEWDTWGVLAAIDKQPTVTASPWHRVEDEMPKDGEWVLIWGDGFYVPIQAFHESECWLDDQFEKYTATHWMPLPEPPKEDA